MNEPQVNADKKAFIEEMGIIYEQMGMYRMAGRIIGWLLICDPPHQSAKELATVLEASKGSISTIIRWLDDSGLVERLGIPGHRSTYYRIKPGAWIEIAKAKTAFHKPLKDLADSGLKLLQGENVQLSARLREMRAFQAFFEKEIPLLLNRFEKEYARTKEQA
jgi:DNA-binding transcriptional regulator GbsR (MarR family)